MSICSRWIATSLLPTLRHGQSPAGLALASRGATLHAVSLRIGIVLLACLCRRACHGALLLLRFYGGYWAATRVTSLRGVLAC